MLTFSSGKSVRVDEHSAWIDDVVASWSDPSLPTQPAAQTIFERNPPKVCPTDSTVGHYSIPTPEAGVTYTWDADGATVFGSGTSVNVMADSTQAFTLTVTATGPEGCARTFEAVFGPQTSPCREEPPSGE